MSTLATRVGPFSRLNPKYPLFAVVGLMLVYVLVHDESFLGNPGDPIWQHWRAAGLPFVALVLAHRVSLSRIQVAEPAAEGGRVRDTIRILERRCCALPRTILQKVSPQCLTACDQTVMGVGRREPREKSEGQSAKVADATAYLDPVVTLVMRLFAPSAVTDD